LGKNGRFFETTYVSSLTVNSASQKTADNGATDLEAHDRHRFTGDRHSVSMMDAHRPIFAAALVAASN
jgi:hypothetical protein